MKIAAIQMPIIDGDWKANKDIASQLIEKNQGAELYLLPELWSSGYCVRKWRLLAEKETPLALQWMRCEAELRKIWLGGSLISYNEEGALCNRFVMFNPEGKKVSTYDKVHRFLPMGEEILAAGENLSTFEIGEWRVAPMICYDLRFPEMFRRLTLETRIDLFLVCSEWPFPRMESLTTLAAARAIENQAYLLLSNRMGVDVNEQQFCGESGVYGPFGKESVLGYNKSGVVISNVELQILHSARRALPILDERRQGVDYE